MNSTPKSSPRVLVVDDNEVNRMILINMLEVFHVHADEAEDGNQAVLLSEKNPYDLILVDHIMPVMNGLKTTLELRSKAINKENVIIVALTADVNEIIRGQYRSVEANDVYAKPIELKDLAMIMKTWRLLEPDESPEQEAGIIKPDEDNELLKGMIVAIEDIDYEAGLKFALGNQIHFIEILEVSLKDLKSCHPIILRSHENNSREELKTAVHKIKNILANIGTLKLYEEASVFERAIKDLSDRDTEYMYQMFYTHLISFEEKLESALERIRATQTNLLSLQVINVLLMSPEEYEQSISNAIYYIKRYEYDAIVRELKKLVQQGAAADREELKNALEDIRIFDYDSALSRIINIKNKTDGISVFE